MPARRAALGAAIALLLVLAVVALVAGRSEDDAGMTVSATGPLAGAVIETTTTNVPTTQPPATTAPSTVAPPPVTPTSRAPAPTATAAPSTSGVPTTAAQGERLMSAAGAHGPVQAALNRGRERWAKGKPSQGYRWSYRNDCFCSPRKLEVDVDGAGNITGVRTEGTSEPRSLELGRTVEAAFAELQQGIDANAASISVRFDPGLGFPSSYYIDRSRRLADEEHGITVTAFFPRS